MNRSARIRLELCSVPRIEQALQARWAAAAEKSFARSRERLERGFVPLTVPAHAGCIGIQARDRAAHIDCIYIATLAIATQLQTCRISVYWMCESAPTNLRKVCITQC